jgi:hypothetical protein
MNDIYFSPVPSAIAFYCLDIEGNIDMYDIKDFPGHT